MLGEDRERGGATHHARKTRVATVTMSTAARPTLLDSLQSVPSAESLKPGRSSVSLLELVEHVLGLGLVRIGTE